MSKNIADFSFFRQNSFGDSILYKELLAIFVRTTPVMISQMQQAALDKDFEQLGKIAHKLKSNIQSIGLDRVYVLLDKVENSSLAQMDPLHLNKILNEVYDICKIAVAEVDKELIDS
ncbi:hypothetical protein BH09BAC1_BH09BAC1_02110 [soil metagenome]